MTQNTSNSSSEAVGIVAAAAVLIAGAFLGVSSLLGARWWVNLIILLVAAGATLAMFDSDPDAGTFVLGLLVLFSLYGFVSTLGWIATVAIFLVTTVVVVLLLSEKPASEPPAPRPPPVRSTVPTPSSPPPPPPSTVPDEVLERYAREFLAEGGTRDTRAVIAALRSRVRDEGLKLGPAQDLSWIASRALASTRSPAPPTGPRRTPAARPRPTAVRQQGVPAAPAKQRTNVRQHLHEFGSFEIERAISRILDGSPGLSDKQLVDRVLGALEISDRSPFAMERLSDAIGRVRGNVSPSAEGRVVRQRERRIARVSKRGPGGRTKLYEYGSHEIERVVEQLLPADRRWVDEDLLEAVLEVLGIEDRSNLARQRVADAAAKISASVAYPPGAGGRLRRPIPKKKPAKKVAAKKTAKKTPKKKAAKKPVKKQPAPKPAAKKATEARKKKTEAAKRQKPASKPDQDRQTGRKTPPPAPAKKPTRSEGESGAPDAKDIGKLLGF